MRPPALTIYNWSTDPLVWFEQSALRSLLFSFDPLLESSHASFLSSQTLARFHTD
jgi:hypothetical protein